MNPLSLAAKQRHQRWKLYCSYALSAWGDRMWCFAVGLALALLGESLRLPAVAGFVGGSAVMMFGPPVGRWIDRTPRIVAAGRCLLINNAAVAISAGTLVSLLYWKDALTLIPIGYYTLLSGAIVFSAVAKLASSGTKIVITRDWVVVICDNDKDLLADMNSVMLRIDLTCMIVSPLIAGQIMTSINMAAGCLFISLWNVTSFILEYYLLWSIHLKVPALSVKKVPTSQELSQYDEATKPTDSAECDKDNDKQTSLIQCEDDTIETANNSTMKVPSRRSCLQLNHCSQSLNNFWNSWRIYRAQPVFQAGLALGLIYMTVLGLDSITTAFAYAQGIAENVLAVVRGAGALVGISGSFAYPFFRRALGLPRAGLLALGLQLICLSACVVSIWLPGSPFDPGSYFESLFGANGPFFWCGSNKEFMLDTNHGNRTSSPNGIIHLNNLTTTDETVDDKGDSVLLHTFHYHTISIWVFLAGVVLARFGLWIADLCISQIYQESVAEDRRGVVNGVQHSLNQSMDMLKNILVICLPEHSTFGLLIIASFSFVCAGFISLLLFNQKQARLLNGERSENPLVDPESVLGKTNIPFDDGNHENGGDVDDDGEENTDDYIKIVPTINTTETLAENPSAPMIPGSPNDRTGERSEDKPRELANNGMYSEDSVPV